ncbi:SDR family NAD(P)-dependent oxidoreductase [Pseudolysinimonas sp.]|uniref:SDR family NAD(P)-dependent oxidoreductase n=1 Tax=Pseudolysinimonas sp. TaxID=2680009 RepID=UPI003F7D759C
MSPSVVVTGASSGIGEAASRLLAAHGWTVLGVARRAERLATLEAEAGVIPVVADVTDPWGVQTVVDAVGSRLGGRLDALVNNAGGALGLDSVEDADLDDWRTMFETNVLGTQRMIAALLPALRAAARVASSDGGAAHADILAVTSIAGTIAYEGGAGYNAAKFAQHALMKVLRLELAGEPLRVIEIAPGMVKTDFSLVRFKGDAARADAVYAGVENPLSADDIAEAIVHALELPGHVNLDEVVIKPVAQAAPHKVIKAPLAPKG